MSRGLCCALLVVATAAGFAAGCAKEKQSLIVVAVRAFDGNGSGLTSLTLDVERGPDKLVSQTYTLQAGLAMGASIKYGIYIPGDATGELRITATAREGADCNGYRGSALPTVVVAGDSVAVAMALRAANVCPATDGGAGSGGAAGANGSDGGLAGAGGSGPAGAGGSGPAGAGGSGPAGAAGSGPAGAGGGAGGPAGSGGAGRGGAGGVAGTTGTGGTGAVGCTGTIPPVGTPPRLTCCREYDHVDASCSVNAYIYAAAFSADGRILLTGGDDGRVKLWTFTGTALNDDIGTLSGAGYGYAAFSKDGKIAVGLESGEIDVWSLSALTAAPTKLLSNSGKPYGVAFTADSQRVISIDSGSIFVHSLTGGGTTTGVLTNVDNYFMTASPALVNNGTGVAITGSDGLAAIYNVVGGVAGTPIILDVTLSPLLSAGFSPSGALLALGDYDARTKFWAYPIANSATLATGADIIIDPVNEYQTVNSIAFSPNGNFVAIAAGYPGDVSIWNVATRTEMYRYPFSTRHGLTAVFSPGGNALVVGERGCGKVLLCTE